MKLYGTLTSPFVRRVRVVAHELGVAVDFHDLLDTRRPAGQDELRRVSPIGKVPVAEIDGAVVFDSHAIVDELLAIHGPGPLRRPSARMSAAERSFILAVDAALESAIRVFYFKRDGVAIEPIPYMCKERDRVGTIMTWLDGQVHGEGCTPEPGFGLAELALVTTLDWMRYRDVHPIGDHPRLLAVREAHAGRPSLQATLPP